MDKLRKGINLMLNDIEKDEDYERGWGSLDDDFDEDLKTLDDYTVFDSIYYPAWKKGRDNYIEGEEEEIWNKLSKHFDLPPYEPASKENNYTTHRFLVNPSEKKVYLAKGKDMIPLKRRLYK